MGMLYFSDSFYDYKSGFSEGVLDFLINFTSGIDFSKELTDGNFWELGYYDAYYYCIEQLSKIKDMNFDVTNILNIINEFYIKRIQKYNSLTGYNVPAFTLVLKSDDFL